MPFAPKVQGGQRWKAFMRTAQANETRANNRSVVVGFLERRISRLAVQLEYGNPDTGLPERPAFRLGVDRIKREAPKEIERLYRARGVADGSFALTDTELAELGRWAEAINRQTYLEFVGPGLSERQAKRKLGTSGSGLELVGSEGPKLIKHIRSDVRRG